MRIAFVQSNGINESLGLTELSAWLKANGRDTRLFLSREDRRFPETIRRYDPQMVLIPCDIMGHNWALRTARELKKVVSAPIVFGGVLPTFYPKIVREPGVDLVVRGEAEGAVLELSERLERREPIQDIPNLVFAEGDTVRDNPMRPLITDLNALPLPDRELYYRYPFIRDFGWKKFSSSRGCVNNCGYCFNPTFQAMMRRPGTRFLRRKSVDRIIEEVRAVQDRYPLRIAHFSDDLFTSGMDFLEPFAREFPRRVGVPFSCNVYAKFVTPESVRLLKQAGCVTLSMGVETADERKRNDLLNKPLTDAQILQAAEEVRKAGIFLITFNMLGLPGGTLEDDLRTLELNRRIRSGHQRIAVTVPIPYSKMAEECVANGRLPPDFLDRVLDLPDLSESSRDTLYRIPDREKVLRLYCLWYLLVGLPVPVSRLRFLLDLPLQRIYRLFLFLGLPREKRAFRLRWREGIRYFYHVGSTANKTTNYVTLI